MVSDRLANISISVVFAISIHVVFEITEYCQLITEPKAPCNIRVSPLKFAQTAGTAIIEPALLAGITVIVSFEEVSTLHVLY